MLLNIDSIIIAVRPQYSQCSSVQYMQFCAVYTLLYYTLVHLYTRALHSCAILHSCSVLVRSPNTKCECSETWGGVYAILAMGSLCQTFVHIRYYSARTFVRTRYYSPAVIFFSIGMLTLSRSFDIYLSVEPQH